MIRRLLLAALAAAAPATAIAAGTTAEGEAAYARLCAECHRNAARVVARYATMYPEDRRLALDGVLKDHHAPDPAARAAIIAWLETRLPQR
jgi:mono/diheme cytochrome c family protein